jgi:pyruvate,water dikinase
MLIDLSAQPPALLAGAKAARLGWLIDRGWPVPPGVVAPFDDAHALTARGGSREAEAVRTGLARHVDPVQRYVIRSSANVEDHGRLSFAGQFASISGVAGVDDIVEAMCVVVESGRSHQVREYAARVGVDPEGLRMAVIVQEMVAPVVSGVAFSRDPVTGHDQVVIEAVTGGGDLLMGRGLTPQRWVSGRTGVLAEPSVALLDAPVVSQIVESVRGIAQASGEPADVEWVWDGTRLHLVQWRPVTGIAQPPRIWSSRMAKDMLPGLIPPLVWSVNVPVLSRTWVDLIEDALGPTGLDPADLVRPFGYRAYFNASAFGSVFASLGMPADSLERMREGTSRSAIRPPMSVLLRRTPRLARFAATLGTWELRTRTLLADVERSRRIEQGAVLEALSDEDLLARVERLCLLLGRAGRLNIVTPLLADAWAASVRRTAAGLGLDPGTIDPGQELPAVRACDPAHALSEVDPDDERAWEEFLDRFGHLSDSPNDCSQPTWAEDPAAVRRLLGPGRARLARIPGGGPVAGSRAELLAAASPARRPLVSGQWSRAARLRLARENAGYTYARVYSLFRPTFLEVGRRLTSRAVLLEVDDVFLLTLAEVADALRGGTADAAGIVASRRAEMQEAADLHWPETIVGDDPVPIRGRARAQVLTGVPTSRGRHTGPARVVTSLATAGDIGPDDVLVLVAADVTWTPLLLRAGAVVTETGGMLSHASIVARELGLPCVASVDGATDIAEGAMVCVDGASGEVLVLGPPHDRDAPGGQDLPPGAEGTVDS